MMDLIENIESREARVGVIGLGYVGLPLLIEFARSGFPVLGLDIDESKIDDLNAGRSYIRHIEPESVRDTIQSNARAEVSADFGRVADCDALLICVPTPLTRHREPDLRFITSTAEAIAPHLCANQLVVL